MDIDLFFARGNFFEKKIPFALPFKKLWIKRVDLQLY
jgi:hypothetical protein